MAKRSALKVVPVEEPKAVVQPNGWTETIVATIPKGRRGEEIRVTLARSPQGTQSVGVRLWYDDELADEMRPTKKGIAIPLDSAEAVAKAILKALK